MKEQFDYPLKPVDSPWSHPVAGVTADVDQRLRRVVVVGCGDVTAKRVNPALAELENVGPVATTFVDLHEGPPFGLRDRQRYLQIDPTRSLLVQLDEGDIELREATALICCPTEHHARYALELSQRFKRVAVEKPLTKNPAEAVRLMQTRTNVFPVGHQLFKEDMLRFIYLCSSGAIDFSAVDRVEFVMHETIGIGQRAIDPVLWDLGWHAFELLFTSLRAAGVARCSTTIVDSQHSYYIDGQRAASVPTSGRLEGYCVTDKGNINFTFSLGKGLAVGKKTMTLHDRRGHEVNQVDLSESGHHAHRRLLQDLLTTDQPNLGLTLAEASEIVGLCEQANFQAEHVADYAFGTQPEWLLGNQ